MKSLIVVEAVPITNSRPAQDAPLCDIEEYIKQRYYGRKVDQSLIADLKEESEYFGQPVCYWVNGVVHTVGSWRDNGNLDC